MLIGFFLILIACFVWGFIFVVPLFMSEYSAFEVAIGRFFFFGLLSSLVLSFKKFKPIRTLSWKTLFRAILYTLLINTIYYTLVVLGIQYANAAVVTLIMGLAPITIAFYANWRDPKYHPSILVLSSVIIGLGLILVNYEAFAWNHSKQLSTYLLGLLCATASLIIWTWFVEANAKFLKDNPEISSENWTFLMGSLNLVWVVTFGCALILYLGPSTFTAKFFTWSDSLKNFLIGSFILGTLCSCIGHLFWNKATRYLHTSVAGQLMVFETIFGILFVFLVEKTFPTFLELIGMTLLLVGVAATLILINRQEARQLTS